MADVDDTLAEWSNTTANNKPTGATVLGTGLDDNIRELQGVIVRGLSHKGSDIASAATTDIGAVEGLMHDITGTTTITGLGTVRAGIWKIIKFEGALTLTHDATSLILLGGASRTTANGDIGIVISEGAGNWREVAWFPSGQAPDGVPKNGGIGKNAIIGGDFSTNPWQRGTSFAAIAHATYSADRWEYAKVTTGAAHTITKAADAPTVAQAGRLSTHCLMVDCTTADVVVAAGDLVAIRQNIEGYNWIPLAQRTITLSFWHKHTKTGIYCVALNNGGGDRSYVAEYVQDTTDTWEKATVTFTASPSAGTWDYTTGIGARLYFTMMAGSTYQTTADAWQTGLFIATANQVNACDDTANNFKIALVQLEAGSVATEFEARSYQQELALCQRYTQKSFLTATAPAQNVGENTGEFVWLTQLAGAAIGGGYVHYKVRMRAAGTVTTYSPAAATAEARDESGALACTGTTVYRDTETGVFLYATGNAGTTAPSAIGVHWLSTAEL